MTTSSRDGFPVTLKKESSYRRPLFRGDAFGRIPTGLLELQHFLRLGGGRYFKIWTKQPFASVESDKKKVVIGLKHTVRHKHRCQQFKHTFSIEIQSLPVSLLILSCGHRDVRTALLSCRRLDGKTSS